MPNISGFIQNERFPGQGSRGGDGSAFLPNLTPPAGSSSSFSPLPPLVLPNLQPSTFNLSTTFTLPTNGQFPTINPFTPSAGTATATTLTVQDGVNTYTGIDTISVSGTLVLTSTGATSVDIYNASGGGGGSTLVYGKITSASRVSGTVALWAYTVMQYVAGVATTSVTAYNLLEKENTSTSAYGYVVTGGDRVTGTSYYVRAVPTNTWVQMENSNAVTGAALYWFSAPNFMDGTC